MKIREIRAAAVTDLGPLGRSAEKYNVFGDNKDYTNPMSRYLEFVGQGARPEESRPCAKPKRWWRRRASSSVTTPI